MSTGATATTPVTAIRPVSPTEALKPAKPVTTSNRTPRIFRKRFAVACAAALLAQLTLGAAPGPDPTPAGASLPERMADTGGGTQLITAEAPRTSATTGTLTWWDLRQDRWHRAGSAEARFGSGGLVEGTERRQGTSTTPIGLYGFPYAFGIKDAPAGTKFSYRQVTDQSWWCQDNNSPHYNRWVEPLPGSCRAAEAEHMITYTGQYDHGLITDFNYDRPVRGRGAGIFLHVNGRGATAGCVSVPADAMTRILAWADPDRSPHLAIGTSTGRTAVTAVTADDTRAMLGGTAKH